jgi:hypothetical protein
MVMKNLVTLKITETSQKKCKSGIILPPMSQDTVSRLSKYFNISIFQYFVFHVRMFAASGCCLLNNFYWCWLSCCSLSLQYSSSTLLFRELLACLLVKWMDLLFSSGHCCSVVPAPQSRYLPHQAPPSPLITRMRSIRRAPLIWYIVHGGWI